MGCGAQKSKIYRDDPNKQTDKLENNEEQKIEKQEENFISDSIQQRNRDAQQQKEYQQTNYPPLPNNSIKIDDNKIQQIPQFKCHLHKNEDIKGIDININVKQKFYCFKCIVELKYTGNDFLYIEDMFNTTPYNKFLQKQPKYQNLINQQKAFDGQNNFDPIYPFLQEKLLSIKKSIVNYIEKYFEQIESILKNIELQKNEIKKSLDSMNYQQQIIEILTQNKNTNELETQITDLMSKQINEQKSLEKKLEEYYQNRDQEVRESHYLIKQFQQKFTSFSQQQSFFSANDLKNSLSQFYKNLNIIIYKEELVQLNTTHIISTYSLISTSQINNHSIQLYSTSDEIYGYLNIELQFQQRYQFQMEFKRKNQDNYIFVGLANQDLIKSNQGQNSNIILYDSRQSSEQVNKMMSIKNRLISEDYQILNKEITLQVCLKDNIFKWKYNDNINCPKQIDFKQNVPQYLFLRAQPNQIITIKSMKKVSLFEDE